MASRCSFSTRGCANLRTKQIPHLLSHTPALLRGEGASEKVVAVDSESLKCSGPITSLSFTPNSTNLAVLAGKTVAFVAVPAGTVMGVG